MSFNITLDIRMKKLLNRIFVTCFALGLAATIAAIIAGGHAMLRMKESIRPINNLEKYEEIMSGWPPILVSHFPQSIDRDKQSKFHYQPGFLQGGSSVQLAVYLASEFDQVVKEFHALGIQSA
ncbi:MAG: hypothetical protein AAF492_11555, partial [Verrucomicrobiota bacterium]